MQRKNQEKRRKNVPWDKSSHQVGQVQGLLCHTGCSIIATCPQDMGQTAKLVALRALPI
jgi:hypothetical protein